MSSEFEAAVSDATAACIWYFGGFEGAIAQCDRDCDVAVAKQDYDKAEEISLFQENLRKVVAMNPQPNAKAILQTFIDEVDEVEFRIEELKAAALLKETELKEQEKAYAAKKQFAKAKECKEAAATVTTDTEKHGKQLQVTSSVWQTWHTAAFTLPCRCSWNARNASWTTSRTPLLKGHGRVTCSA
jgi:hypothetical protein